MPWYVAGSIIAVVVMLVAPLIQSVYGLPVSYAKTAVYCVWLSMSIMVTAPASTGITATSKNAVISQVHTNRGIFIYVMPGARRFITVAMMLMEPMMEDSPRTCTEKIKKVTDGGA